MIKPEEIPNGYGLIYVKRIIPFLLLLMLQTVVVCAQDTCDRHNDAIQVEGTELAKLQDVMDILRMLPGISIEDGNITVTGRGTPAIYIDKRKISDFSELMHITADRVKEIEILWQPGAEYDKDVASVIIVRLKSDLAEGFYLDNSLRLDLTHKISKNDELSFGWRRRGLTLGAFIGWNENQRTFERYLFTNKYQDQQLISEEKKLMHPDVKKQQFTTRLSASYDFNRNNKLTFNYSFVNKVVDHTKVPEFSQFSRQPGSHHDFALVYTGKIGEWNLTAGNNSFIDNAGQISESPSSSSYYLRKEFDIRTYATASRAFWKGRLSLGAEHELDNMDIKMYEDNPAYSPLEKIYFNTHAVHPDNTLGVFATATSSFGPWNIEAGLRYEHIQSAYRPCGDDGLMKFLDDYYKTHEYDFEDKSYLIPILLALREVKYDQSFLYPSLKVSVSLGKSELSLKHTENSVHPYLGITRLRYSEMELLHEKILKAEKASATSLEWRYDKWAGIAAAYSHYNKPICTTLSSSNQYNAPDYGAIDLDLTLAPKIGIWTPILHARFHKQWFQMPLANGKDRLLQPLAKITWNNNLTLPHDWTIHLNAQWHSRGADRNTYYYSPDFRMDATIQKILPKQGLTFVLSASNIFNGSYNDISCYVQDYYGISQGVRDQIPRVISLTVRYKLK